jgi:hypothetical protein
MPIQPDLSVVFFPTPRLYWLAYPDRQNACFSCPAEVIPEFHYNRFLWQPYIEGMFILKHLKL